MSPGPRGIGAAGSGEGRVLYEDPHGTWHLNPSLGAVLQGWISTHGPDSGSPRQALPKGKAAARASLVPRKSQEHGEGGGVGERGDEKGWRREPS